MIIRYDFGVDRSSSSPQLVYMIKDECFYAFDPNEVSTHFIAELIYVISGKGNARIEEDRHELSAGSFYIVNPYVKHGEYLQEGQGFTYYIFGISNFILYPSEDFNPMIPVKLERTDAIPSLIDHIFRELSNEREQKESAMEHYFRILLIEIERKYKQTVQHSDEAENDAIMRIKNYIDVNWAGNISSKTIADDFGFQQNTIAKNFKKAFGCSIQQYILFKRIERAKQRLDTENISISELTFKCGFNNCSYFCKYFKKVTGLTPVEYRKKNRIRSDKDKKTAPNARK